MDFKISPIQFTLDILSRKWTIEILENLRTGRKRYSDLLNLNEQITSKVLSERLKELYELGLIDKIITNIMPVKAKYELTEKGHYLIPIFFEMALFSSLNFPEIIFTNDRTREDEIVTYFGNHYNLNTDEMKVIKMRLKRSNER